MSAVSAPPIGTFTKVQFPILIVAMLAIPARSDSPDTPVTCAFVSCTRKPRTITLARSSNVNGQPVSMTKAMRRPLIMVVANKWLPNRRCKGDPPKPSRSKNVFSAAGSDPAARLMSAQKQTTAITTSPRRNFFMGFFLVQFGCLKQLIWIDIDGGEDVFWQRQFIERLAHESAQPHDCFAAQQDVKSKLA